MSRPHLQETSEPEYVGPDLLDIVLARDHTAFVGQLAFRALQNFRDQRSPITHRQLYKELESLARRAVIEALRQLNSSTSQRRLPNEVWLEIWAYLPLRDRGYAARVCSSWRRLAVDSPRLSRHLDAYHSAVHDDDDDDCDCTAEGPCLISDLFLLEPVLRRSKDLPLSLHLTVGRFSVYLEDQLSTMLQSVTGRLEYLYLESKSIGALGSTLCALFDLPKLRRLVIASKDKHRADLLWHTTPNLPALESFEVISSAPFVVGTNTPRSLPSLKTLRFPFATSGEVLDYLKASPQLRAMFLDGCLHANAGAHTWSATHREEIRHTSKSVSRISVSYILPEAEEALLAIFHLESRSEIALAYRSRFAAAQLAGVAIFADVTSPVRLSLAHEREMLVARAIGGCGRKREICGIFDASELINAIATKLNAVRELIIDLNLLDALNRCPTHWPDVELLTVRLSRVDSISHDLPHGKVSARAWRRLSTLHLEPHDNNRITVSASAVQHIVQFVYRGDLDTLVLSSVDGVTLEALSSLARNVVLNGRRIAVPL